MGARPQFIKLAPLSRALRRRFSEVLIHTGQHYDSGMSDVFFLELEIPKPDYHLGVGGGLQGEQTGKMLAEIERVLVGESPDIVAVIGDTNSTLAGALAASKLHIPVAHIEAGLRSFNRKMPEEINRVMTDHLSRWLFATSDIAINHLKREGITQGIYDVGDIMFDSILFAKTKVEAEDKLLNELSLKHREYYFCTLHRAENTDDKNILSRLLRGLSELNLPIIFPLHPRTKKRIAEFNLELPKSIRAIEPVGYLDSVSLMMKAAAVLTDSGGIQKEAYYLEVPCITLREETEWVETADVGWNAIVGSDPQKLLNAISQLSSVRTRKHPPLYGSGNTAEKISEILALE